MNVRLGDFNIKEKARMGILRASNVMIGGSSKPAEVEKEALLAMLEEIMPVDVDVAAEIDKILANQEALIGGSVE